MTTFFEQQEVARQKTFILLGYFALAVIGIVLSVYAVAFFLFSHTAPNIKNSSFSFIQPDILAMVSVGVLIVISLGTISKIFMLKGGGAVVAESLGGKLLLPGTTEPAQRMLLNVVEEMAIASGVPVPPVYVLTKEESINAFAAGYSLSDAVVAVTNGCLNNLTREEIQGVIAHEFSHIFNGDMRLNIRLIGLLNGILIIAIIGRHLLSIRSSSNNNKSGSLIVFIGLALYLIGYIGVIFGTIIQAAVCRQREYLADSCAVQFTRNPRGLAGALRRISSWVNGSGVNHPRAQEISHMFFASGVSSFLKHLFSTHPKIQDRIKRLNILGGTITEVPEDTTGEVNVSTSINPSQLVSGFASSPFSPEVLKSRIGSPSETDLQFARKILKNISPRILDIARDPYGARAVVYALLLENARRVQDWQLQYLDTNEPNNVVALMSEIQPLVASLNASQRFSLFIYCFPTLKFLSPRQTETFKKNVETMIMANSDVSMFEFALYNMLKTTFWPKKFKIKQVSKADLSRAIFDLLLMLSSSSGNTEAEKKEALQAALSVLPSTGNWMVHYQSVDVNVRNLNKCLNILKNSSINIKMAVMEACAKCVSFDGKIRDREIEIIRAVGAVLDCPVPRIGEIPHRNGVHGEFKTTDNG